MKKKVSFDFDSTLDVLRIQSFASMLIDQGIEVWVVTSRPPDKPDTGWWIQSNNDLYEVTDKLNIPRERIVFTGYANKSEFFEDKDFIWHLDDDEVEIRFINDDTKVKGILKTKRGKDNWKKECLNLINGL